MNNTTHVPKYVEFGHYTSSSDVTRKGRPSRLLPTRDGSHIDFLSLFLEPRQRSIVQAYEASSWLHPTELAQGLDLDLSLLHLCGHAEQVESARNLVLSTMLGNAQNAIRW
jgi:hypothetical protein